MPTDPNLSPRQHAVSLDGPTPANANSTAADGPPRDAGHRRDHLLAELASRQHGVVADAQLLALGFSPSLIRHRRDRGWLHRIGPNVHAVGHVGVSRRGRGMAALLQAGNGAGLSYSTAARLWEMVGRASDGPIHISVPDRSRLVAPHGVVMHRPRALPAHDLVDLRGLRVTTPERTLRDLLLSSSVVEITRMLEQMVTTLGRSPDQLHTWGSALHGTRGKSKLLRALDEVAGPAVIRSEFESRFRSLCQAAAIPAAQTNYRVAGWEVDAVWVAEGVAVELDGYRWHGGRWQFHRDRRKGLAISRAGYELIRLSWPQLKHERAHVVEAIRCALARGHRRMT